MVYPTTVLEATVEAIRDEGRMPSDTTYATIELDNDGDHADVRPPVLEIQPGTLERGPHNTERAGFVTDDQGNQIARKYRTSFTLDIELACVTAGSSSTSARSMAQSLRETLRLHDTRAIGNPLPDPNSSGKLTDVCRFAVSERTQANDLSMAPPMRRTRTVVTCDFVDTYDTLEYTDELDYIETVTTPSDGDFSDDPDVDGAIETDLA